MFYSLKSRLKKRAQYNQTLYELRAMPVETAADLNLSKDDFPAIAYQAVYGN